MIGSFARITLLVVKGISAMEPALFPLPLWGRVRGGGNQKSETHERFSAPPHTPLSTSPPAHVGPARYAPFMIQIAQALSIGGREPCALRGDVAIKAVATA
ncbi:MAG: hypothetical protein BGP05_07045 [Rhizobiales bacterium 62-47]|nr:MAG: hypothetical protein BGP05_07045 [Rhizobiales bacterium 62-47]